MNINNNNDINNVFSLFPKYNLEQANTVKKTDFISSTAPNTKSSTIPDTDSTNQSKSKKRKFIFGSTLASSILTAGIFAMVFAKGFHGSSLKKLSKYTEGISKRIQAQNTAPKTVKNKIVYSARKGVKKTIDTMQSASNFTALKDWIADKIYRTNRATAKFADASTSFFKKIVDKTLGKRYDAVGIKVKDLTSVLKQFGIDNINSLTEKDLAQEVNIKGTIKSLSEWLEILSQQSQRLQSNFDNNFSLGARRLRDKKRQKLLRDLPQKIGERFFTNKKELFNLKNYKTYATEDLSKAAQEELKEEIIKAKKQVSNNITTINESIKTAINTFTQSILPEDEVSRKSVSLLKERMEQFKKCSGPNEAKARELISKRILSIVDDLIKITKKNSAYTQEQRTEMLKALTSVQETVLSAGIGSKGSLEEIMTILNGLNKSKLKSTKAKIVSDEAYKEYSKLASAISKKIEKAAELEAGEYFLKQAELKVGSAPNDVLSVLFPIGVGTYAIAKGDDKDEKISATLTTCIPLVGTFATFVYGTVKMLSGAKNLAFSLISGFILNRMGNYADKLYKKYRSSGSVVNVVKDEYEKFWTGLSPQFEEQENTKKSKKSK